MQQKEKDRKYQLTINNPQDHNMSHDNIKSLILKIAQVIYWCMSDEIGLETQTHHTHVFIQFKNEVKFTTIKKYFPMAHIEIANGTPFENRNYIRTILPIASVANLLGHLEETNEKHYNYDVLTQKIKLECVTQMYETYSKVA